MQLTFEQLLEKFSNLIYFNDEWLHYFHTDKKYGNLSPSTQLMADDLRKYIKTRQDRKAWEVCDQLYQFVLKYGSPEEIGDVDVICAWVESQIGHLSKAKDFLLDASERFLSDEHEHAVTLWILGVVLWRQGDIHKWEAIKYWEICLNWFRVLRSNNQLGKVRSDWYSERCDEIERFLEGIRKLLAGASSQARPGASASDQTTASVTARSLGLSQQPDGTYTENPPAKPEPSQGPAGGSEETSIPHPKQPPQTPDRIPPAQPGGWLRFYPILPGAVSAGKLKKIYHHKEYERLDTSEVQIGDKHFQVVSLKGNNRIVNLKGVEMPYILKVQGDSLDSYPILPGDYVIVNPVEINPFDERILDGRIVVTITNEDLTNIKVLRRDGKDLYLDYRSKNPDYIGRSDQFDRGWKIVGEVVARLTPK
jgi:hypothetical protein